MMATINVTCILMMSYSRIRGAMSALLPGLSRVALARRFDNPAFFGVVGQFGRRKLNDVLASVLQLTLRALQFVLIGQQSLFDCVENLSTTFEVSEVYHHQLMVFPVDVRRPSARSLRRPRADSSGGSGEPSRHAHPAPFVRGTVISQALRYPRGNGFYRRVLIAEDEVAPEGLGPRRRRPAKALRARCGLFLTITVCVLHTSAARAFNQVALAAMGM